MLLSWQVSPGINWDSWCYRHQQPTTDKINNKHGTLAIKLHGYGCSVDQRPLLRVISTPTPPLDGQWAVILPAWWLWSKVCATVASWWQLPAVTGNQYRIWVQHKYRPSTDTAQYHWYRPILDTGRSNPSSELLHHSVMAEIQPCNLLTATLTS